MRETGVLDTFLLQKPTSHFKMLSLKNMNVDLVGFVGIKTMVKIYQNPKGW